MVAGVCYYVDAMTRGRSTVENAVIESVVQLASLSTGTRQRMQMAANGLRHLSKPSVADWVYNRSHISSLCSWLFAGELEALQQFNPTAGFVSTPIDGIGAGFTATGRLSTLLFPHTGFTHQIPFYVSGDGHEQRSKPMEGGFAGIEMANERTWFWDDGTEHEIGYRGNSGILDITAACDDFVVTESAYVYPGSETVVRDFTLENTSKERQTCSFIYHTRANVNDNDQTFAVWNSNINRLTGSDDLHWDDVQGPYELRIWSNADRVRTETDGALSLGNSAVGKYLSGRLLVDVTLPPGETEDISVFINGTSGGAQSTATPSILTDADQKERQEAVESWWETWISDLELETIPDSFTDLYVRSAVTLGKLIDPDSGSLSASPNLQPMYYPSWIRDNAFGAVALARMGKPEPAKELLAGFCPAVQEPDGSFRQCYNSKGGFTGIITVENDQQPLFVWAVAEVYRETGDEQFVERAWPAVEQALDYTIDVIDGNGLLAASPDIAEYPSDVRQSLWTNAFAYRGFQDGAMLAELRGEDGTPYRRAARIVGDAIKRELFDQGPSNPSRLVMNGGSEVMLYDACAIYPTEWADAYDTDDQLFAELSHMVGSAWDDWVPASLMSAAMFYSRGEQEQGDALIEEMSNETTETGYLVETRSQDGSYYFASPLAWSHAAFIYALATMYLD